MADSKITQFGVATSMATGDIMPLVSSPSVSPVTKSITRANFMGGTNISQVVGTTETQTLTNKTLTSPKINESVAVTTTATELNYVSGVTSAIQTQLNTKGTGDASTNTSSSVDNELVLFSSTTGKLVKRATGTGLVTVTSGVYGTNSTTLGTNSITLAGGEVITFSASNALSLLTSGTTSMTFPAATDTVAVLGTAQTYTATQTEKQVVWTNNAITASANAATVPITSRLNTVTNNSAATLTITMTTTSAVDGQLSMVRILDFSGVSQTITWVNTENSTISVPTTSNGSTTLFLTVGFIYNSSTSKWRCIAVA